MSGTHNSASYDDDYVGGLKDHIGIAVRTALTVAEDDGSDTNGAFTHDILLQVSKSVVYQLGMDDDAADEYEGHILDCIAAFSRAAIDTKSLDLLTQVIQSAIEPYLTSRDMSGNYLPNEEDDDDDEPDSENVDQLGDADMPTAHQNQIQHQDTGVRARRKSEQIQLNDSITTTSNNSDLQNEQAELDQWMDTVMAKSEQDYLAEESEYSHHEDSHSKARARQYAVAEDSGAEDIEPQQSSDESVQEVRRLPECKNASSPSSSSSIGSDDTLHSERSLERRQHSGRQPEFASPEPYQVRKSAHASGSSGDQNPGAADAAPLPAWLLPKSPLDSHFRKGYGGLGHQDLDEAIAEVTSSQKKALRESKIADDNEKDSLQSDTSDDDRIVKGSRHNGAQPAWEIPKSPLDAHFRKGYGGLGHADFNEAVEEITTAQKQARAAVRAHKRQVERKVGRLYSESSECESVGSSAWRSDSDAGLDAQRDDDDDDVGDGENLITVDDLPDDFGAPRAYTALNPTTVGTPVQKRSPFTRGGVSESKTPTADGPANRSRGSEYADRTKLFQSPNPSAIRVTVSSRSGTGSAGKKISAGMSAEEPLPAWEIPKSPLDAHFRKGYGGLGHEELGDVIAEVTSSQKKRAAGSRLQRDATDRDFRGSINKMLKSWLDHKQPTASNKGTSGASATARRGSKKGTGIEAAGASAAPRRPTVTPAESSRAAPKPKSNKKASPKQKTATRLASRKKQVRGDGSGAGLGAASEQIMFDRPTPSTTEKEYEGKDREFSLADAFETELLGDDAEGSHLRPDAHPAERPTVDTSGHIKLTSNSNLNDMITESYRAHLAQYADQRAAPAKSPASTGKRGSGRKVEESAVDHDILDFLASPQLQHSMDEIDDIIRANLSKLQGMRGKERAARENKEDSRPTSGRAPKSGKTVRGSASEPKLTRRSASSYLIAPLPETANNGHRAFSAEKKPTPTKVKKHKHRELTRCKSMYPLHLRGIGNLRASTHPETSKPPTATTVASSNPVSRRSSLSTSASAAARLSEPSAEKTSRSRSAGRPQDLHSKPTVSTEAKFSHGQSADADRRVSPPRARPLSSTSRLLAPTQSALVRAADIACNSSKAANLHNEWHLHLREDGPEGDDLPHLPERKLRNEALRRSLPAGGVGADGIIGWSSPDRKSKSIDGSLGLRHRALQGLGNRSGISNDTPQFSTPSSSPLRSWPAARRRNSDPVYRYVPLLARDSRLTEPTVAAVMRSLDAAQQSPVIQRLQRELDERTTKAYLFRGPKFAKNLASFQQSQTKKRRKIKKKRSGKRKD